MTESFWYHHRCSLQFNNYIYYKFIYFHNLFSSKLKLDYVYHCRLFNLFLILLILLLILQFGKVIYFFYKISFYS